MKKLLRFGTLMSMVVIMIISISACGTKKGTSSDNTFRVGLECSYPPFNWTQVNAEGGVAISGGSEYAGGYDVEIAKKIAEGLGKELVIVKTAWEGLIPAVQSGTIDAIIAGMSPREDRKLTIDFTEPYYTSELIIVVKKGSPFENAKSLEDFKGAKLTAQLSTLHYDVLDQVPNVDKVTAMEDFGAMRVALSAGMIDGYISEKPEGVSATEINPSFTFVAFDEGNGFAVEDSDVQVSVGLKKGQEQLIEDINKILAEITEDERIQLMNDAVANQPGLN